MRWGAKIGIHALALTLLLAPVLMACLVPTATLTAAERDCCKQMAGRCGKAGMENSHSCCQRLASREELKFVKAKPNQVSPQFCAVAFRVPAAAQSLIGVNFSVIQFLSGIHSPPQSPTASIAILRI